MELAITWYIEESENLIQEIVSVESEFWELWWNFLLLKCCFWDVYQCWKCIWLDFVFWNLQTLFYHTWIIFLCILFLIFHYLLCKMDYALSDLIYVNTVLLSDRIMKRLSLSQWAQLWLLYWKKVKIYLQICYGRF